MHSAACLFLTSLPPNFPSHRLSNSGIHLLHIQFFPPPQNLQLEPNHLLLSSHSRLPDLRTLNVDPNPPSSTYTSIQHSATVAPHRSSSAPKPPPQPPSSLHRQLYQCCPTHYWLYSNTLPVYHILSQTVTVTQNMPICLQISSAC